MEIRKLSDDREKQAVASAILEELTDWFGIAESREAYIRDCRGRTVLCAVHEERPVGFVCLKQTGKDTAELAVMGVLEPYHRQGVGRALLERAKAEARAAGYSFLQVKTVRMGKYAEYDRTNRFYLAMGFKEFEVFPTLWDRQNPCQIYVMALK